MDMDKILERANSIALKAVKQQRKEHLAKIRFLDELAALFQEMVKQSRADRLAKRARARKFSKLTYPEGKLGDRDGKLRG